MCPHWAHRRRWNHQPPAASHSTHPVPLGTADGSIPATALADIPHRPPEKGLAMEPGTYGTDGTDPEEASGVLEPEDTLDGTPGVRDVLDTGWSPPERPWAVDDWGTTEAEESAGESLDGRLARELPDDVGNGGDGLGDSSDADGGGADDSDDELFAWDRGIDGAGASAEEAAVHIVRDRD